MFDAYASIQQMLPGCGMDGGDKKSALSLFNGKLPTSEVLLRALEKKSVDICIPKSSCSCQGSLS